MTTRMSEETDSIMKLQLKLWTNLDISHFRPDLKTNLDHADKRPHGGQIPTKRAAMFDELVGHALVNVHARRRHADLTGIEDDGESCGVGGFFQVCIFEDQ